MPVTISGSTGVGVGTSPAYASDITIGVIPITANSQSVAMRLFGTSGANIDTLEVSNVRGTDGSTWPSSGWRIQQRVDSSWMGYIQFNGTKSGNNDGGISFGTGSTGINANSVAERLRIDGTGNVGIGTVASTGVRLQVSSSLTGTTTRSNTVLRVQSEATGRDVHIQLSDNITNSAELGMVGGAMYMATAGDERMRIDSSGNVGIGVTSLNSNNKLEIKGQISDTDGFGLNQGQLRISDIDNTEACLLIGYRYNTGVIEYARLQARNNASGTPIAINPGGGNVSIGTVPSYFSTNTTTSANLYVAGTIYIRPNTTTQNRFYYLNVEAAGTFTIYNAAGVGQYMTYGGTTWVANSDERLKTALTPFSNAIEKVCTLRAGTGRYLKDDESVSRSFLIAQDVQQVLPEAVDVQEDEIGTLGLRYTEVIPLLTAAIQEQQLLIASLTSRITALENK